MLPLLTVNLQIVFVLNSYFGFMLCLVIIVAFLLNYLKSWAKNDEALTFHSFM